MEQITECIAKKDPDKMDVIKKTGVVVLAFFGAILAMMIAASVPILNSMGLFFAAAVVYIAYRFAQTTDIEFEYCIVNGDIDIDRIFAKKRRKRYISVTADRIEKVVPAESEELNSTEVKKTYFAARSKTDDTNYAVLYRGKTGLEKLIIVDDDKTLLHLQTVMPRKVQRRV
ncbi:MAG: hypothetical protein IJE46_03240 [Clostridia bacterium]|nr:hypothetical protein [Clostridia bacterium]